MKIQVVYDEAFYDRIMEEALTELAEKPEYRKHLKATDRLIEDVEDLDRDITDLIREEEEA